MSDIELNDIQLPAGWVTTSLGDLCDLYQPKTISSKEMVIDGAYPVFGANGIIGRYSEYNHEESEVLLSCRGNVGTVNVSVPKAWVTGNSMVCSPKDQRITKACLAHLLESADLRAAITGTAQQQITRRSLSPIVVLLPPLAEQERIVEILDEQLSRLDAALESVRVVREKAAQFRRSLLHAAFTGTLTGHNPADGELPEGWELSPIGDHATISTGKIDVNASVVDGQFPFFTCARETYRIDVAPYEGKAVLVAGNGDLNVKYFEGRFNAYQRTYFLFSKNEETLLPRYLFHFLQNYVHHLRTVAIGTTIKYIKLGDLRDAPIAVPPLTEQEQIIEVLEEQLSRLDAALAIADAIEKRSAALRRSLLHAAFTGRLTEQWRESVHV